MVTFFYGIVLQFSMDSVKEELHSDSEGCPMVLPSEEISFVMKHELLLDPEAVPLTDNTNMVRLLKFFLLIAYHIVFN